MATVREIMKQQKSTEPTAIKKMKCRVCGCRFFPTKELKQIVGEKVNIFSSNYYDAYDCPACGCQVVAGKRMEGQEREL